MRSILPDPTRTIPYPPCPCGHGGGLIASRRITGEDGERYTVCDHCYPSGDVSPGPGPYGWCASCLTEPATRLAVFAGAGHPDYDPHVVIPTCGGCNLDAPRRRQLAHHGVGVLAAWPLSLESDGPGPFLLGCVFVLAYVAAYVHGARKAARGKACTMCGGPSGGHARAQSGREWCVGCWPIVQRQAAQQQQAVGR